MKSITEITLYDLMAEDLDVWVTPNAKFGFDITLDDEKGNPIIHQDGLHPYAVESFAEFCRHYLSSYDKAASMEAV